MKRIMNKHKISFRNALNGIIWAFSTQPNFRIHFTLSVLVLIGGQLLSVGRVEMMILVLAIILGLSVEMVNTSIEAVSDMLTSEWSRQAKIAKDVAAGMMLLTAYGTLLIACIILLPRIIYLLI